MTIYGYGGCPQVCVGEEGCKRGVVSALALVLEALAQIPIPFSLTVIAQFSEDNTQQEANKNKKTMTF